MIMNKQYILIFISFILIGGCATQKLVVQPKKAIVEIPPGLDSLTVLTADSIFSQVLVSEETEVEAKQVFDRAQYIWSLGDSLWLSGEKDTLDHLDSIRVSQHVLEAQDYLRLDKVNYKIIKKSQKKLGKFHRDVLKSMSHVLMMQAITHYENAIHQNRFDIRFRQMLFQNLQTMYQRTKDKNYLRRAAVEMEHVVTNIKDNHGFYFQLGERYFQLGEWAQAFNNYEKATRTLRTASIFYTQNPELYWYRPNEVPVDTTILVNYLYRQARCKMRLYEDKPSLALLREAQQITPSAEFDKTFQLLIDWILWDNGNIRASEKRDLADSLRVGEKYIAAKNVYLTLLQILWTKRTHDEIDWRIAVIDYFRLNNKSGGLDRMHQVVKFSDTDSLTGAPVDSAYQKYFDNYGTMCYNSAVEFSQTDLTKAYIYFSQATDTYNAQQGRAFLQLASLSQFDPNETIHLCNKVKNYFNSLTAIEKKLLYELYFKSYRKLGDFTASKQWFDQWKNLD